MPSPSGQYAAARRLTGAGPGPVVGLLIDSLRDGYQECVLRGAVDAARDGGATLLCFVGGALASGRGPASARGGLFDLASSKTVDGIVIATGAIGNLVQAREIEGYCDRFRPLPMCTVGRRIDGCSSVTIDNASGMSAAVQHLVEVHRHRAIAFVRGPAANPEAEARFGAYAGALAGAGITFAPELVADGDFETPSGREAVRTLLERRKISAHSLDAIVAANDAMAMGVIEELVERSVRVPDQIAVVGFDDIEESRLTLPALTTVRQPLREQGRDAVRAVLRMLREPSADHRVLPTELVIRASCGCLGSRPAHAARTTDVRAPLGLDAAIIERHEVIVAAVSRAAQGRFGAAGPDWSERLVNAFVEQMRAPGQLALVRAYDDLLRRLSAKGGDLTLCNDVVSSLRWAALPCFGGDSARLAQAEEAFHDLRVMTAEAIDRMQAWRRIHAERRAHALGRVATAIASSTDRQELMAATAQLADVGIPGCFLVRSDARDAPSVAEALRRDVLSAAAGQPLAILPLPHDGHAVVFALGDADVGVYEVLRDAFAAATKRADTTSDH